MSDALDLYNRLLGNRTRRPIRSATRGRAPSRIATNRNVRVARAKRNPKSTYNDRSSGALGSFSGSYSPENIDTQWSNTVNRLMEDYTRAAAEQEATNRINQERIEEENDLPWYQDIQQAIGLTNPFDPNQGFSSSIIGRALDLVSRPAYGLAEGMRRTVGMEDQGWDLPNMGSALANLGSGVFAGLTGQAKPGFGNVYEEWKNNENTSIGRGLTALEQSHPLLEQRLAQTLGFGGELFLDPLNHMIPTRSRVISETGETATAATLRAAVERTADELSRDLTTGNPHWMRNPDLVHNRARDVANDTFDNTVLDINTGGQRRTRLNNRLFPETASSRIAAGVRDEVEMPLLEAVRSWRTGMVGTGTPTVRNAFTFRKFQNLLAKNPEFQEFYDELVRRLEADGTLVPGSSQMDVYQIWRQPAITKSRHWDEAARVVLSKYDGEFEHFRDTLASQLRTVSYPTIGVRAFGKEIPFKRVGRAYKAARGSKLGSKIPVDASLFDRMSISQMLPDRLSLFSTRARSAGATGMPSLQKFNDNLRTLGRDFTEKEMADLQKYLDEGTYSVGDPRIDQALIFLRDEYRKIWEADVQYGVRPEMGSFADDYNFLWNKGGTKANREKFKAMRKQAFKNGKVRGAGEWGIQRAREMGLKPTEHAFENLYRRYEKMQRDITRQLFLHDLFDNFGLMTKKLTPDMQRKLKLSEVSIDNLPENIRDAMKKSGDSAYLPEVMYTGDYTGKGPKGAYEDFVDMLSWSPENSGRFARNFAKIINMIKFAQTVPNFGFHMRNMLGDVTMALMDDINPADYARIMKKFATKGDFEIVPGITLTWQEMVNLFHKNADTGFFQMDTGTYNSLTGGSIPKDLSRNVINKARRASDIREEMGRFVHFATAYQQEARALWEKGMRNTDRIAQQAEDVALWRVNAYKFDYGALTPFEKQLKTMAFPFMTYMRKAIPLLLEQMYSNPQYLSLANRFMQYNDGSGSDAFNHLNIPQYIKDMGFAVVNDSETPGIITSDALGLGALNLLSARTPQDFFRKGLANLNPLAAAPIELGTNRDLYFDRPLNQSWQEYLMNQIPLAPELQSEAGINIPGIEGEVGHENPLTARMLGLGFPYRTVSLNQQEQQMEENVDAAIDSPIKQFNYSQDTYEINEEMQGGRLVFILRNKVTKQNVAMSDNPNDLIEQAQSMPQANLPEVSPMRQPTYQDVLRMIGQ